jgi:hypothetical protein
LKRRRKSRFAIRRTGPIVGVMSRSEVESIGSWEGLKSPYNEWQFIAKTPFSRKKLKPGTRPPRARDLKESPFGSRDSDRSGSQGRAGRRGRDR